MATGDMATGPKAMHKNVMKQMAHDQMKELVQQALKESYDPKPKKGKGGGSEPMGPSYDEQCRIVDKGMTNDHVTFEQKGKTYTQGYAINNGVAELLGTRQPVMITYAPIPGGSQDSGTQDTGALDEAALEAEAAGQAETVPAQATPTKKGKMPAGLAAYLAKKKAAAG